MSSPHWPSKPSLPSSVDPLAFLPFPCCSHSSPFLHRPPPPLSSRSAILIMQTDMTSRALMEAKLAEVSEAQLTMLSNIFPR